MRFFKSHLATIADVEIYPLTALLLFFVIFMIVLWWAYGAPKQYFEGASKLPFEEESEETKPLEDETTNS